MCTQKRKKLLLKKQLTKQLVWVGWREWLDLPDLSIYNIKAKIDTGARTSSLHAIHIEPTFEKGAPWVYFVVHPKQRSQKENIACHAPILDQRWIKSSNGRQEKRFVIETTMCLGGIIQTIEVTLANRALMGFRMLLGRTALQRYFIVCPDQSFLT